MSPDLLRLLSLAATALCIGAGVYLLMSETADPDSYLKTIAHGIGIYMIGKGVFVGAVLYWYAAREDRVWDEREAAGRREPPAPERIMAPKRPK